MRYLQWTLWSVGLALQYAVLAALLRGPFREFRIVFVYVFLLAATTIGDITALYTVGRTSTFYPKYYWAAELARQTGLFTVVMSLAMVLVPTGRLRRAILNLTIGGAFLFWLGSITLTYQPDLNAWMTRVVRNLSFGSAIVDLGVWFALISSGSRDTRRLLIAGGLGLQMTGEAMGQSIRNLYSQHPNVVLASALLTVGAHFLCLLIWRYAFTRSTVAT